MPPSVAQLCLSSQPAQAKQGLRSSPGKTGKKVGNSKLVTSISHSNRKRKMETMSEVHGIEITPLSKCAKQTQSPDRPTPPKVDARKRRLRMCGPCDIQTIRGQILGREVAMIICGEAHERAIDLTRRKAIVQREEDWIEISSSDRSGFRYRKAVATRKGITLKAAQSWAKRLVTSYVYDGPDESGDEEFNDGREFYSIEEILVRRGPRNYLMFVPERGGAGANAKGTARIFAKPSRPRAEHRLPANALLFELGDTDEQARHNGRACQFTDVPDEQLDAVIDERKVKRLEDGFELFDDWLIRHMGSSSVHMEFLSEAPVKAEEVEVHVEQNIGEVPLAHKCLREIEMDGDSDTGSEDEDGSGSYADYLQRRVEKNIPSERVHGIDPRILGTDPIYEHLASEQLPKDAEELRWEQLQYVPEKLPLVVPSWESFFGNTAQLVYYHNGAKVDYAPFLRSCVGSSENFKIFFKELYFGTLPNALEKLQIDATTIPMTRIRSSTLDRDAESAPVIRPDIRELIPIQRAPLERCLKSRGSEVARTWVSALSQQLRCAGATDLAAAAESWYMDSVEKLLDDPKNGDGSGDYFGAWLRECHSDIYKDIDTSDPYKMLKSSKMYSYDRPPSKKLCHNLKSITIPNLAAGFDELQAWDPTKRASNARERLIAQIFIDAYQLRLVDLSAVLKMAALTLSAPKGKPVAIILYAGQDHTKSVCDFWRSQGFGHDGLPNKGYVGKKNFREDEPRALSLPSYLHDFGELFTACP